jgi:hypothetical protein
MLAFFLSRRASRLSAWCWMALAAFCLSGLAAAQMTAPTASAAPTLASLNIEIWPEYDRPAGLVILRGVLAESVKLPAAVSLRLPAASGGPAAVAHAATADGNLLNLPYQSESAGDAITVQFDAPSRFFNLEFYEPMNVGDTARSFRYVWPGDLAVGRATLVVQEPVGALGMLVDPNIPQTQSGQEGINYRVGDLGALPAGKPLSITVRYTKSDTRPTTEIKGIATAQPAADPPAAMASAATPTPVPSSLPPWVVPVGGFAAFGILVALIVLWLWRRQSAGSATAPVAATAGFCTKCGAPLATGNHFCGKCGAKAG